MSRTFRSAIKDQTQRKEEFPRLSDAGRWQVWTYLIARWRGFGTKREEHETSRDLDREARNRIMLVWLVQGLFKDQMNVTPQVSMAALLAYPGTRTSFAVWDKLYRAFIARNRPQYEGRPLGTASPTSWKEV